MGTNEWTADPFSQTYPPNAPPNTPRIFLGPDIPAELVAWGAPLGVVFVAVEIFYYDDTHYEFHGIGTFTGLTSYIEGLYDPLNTVYVLRRDVLVGGTGLGSIDIRIGSSALNTFRMLYSFQRADVTVTSTSSFALSSGAAFTVDGTSMPRRRVFRADSVVNSGAIGVEAVVLTSAATLFQTGRAYQLRWESALLPSVANQTTMRVRRHDLLGAILTEWYEPMAVAAQNTQRLGTAEIRNDLAAITDTLVLTVQASAGTTTQIGSALSVRKFEGWDIGASTDYATSKQV